MVLTMIYYIYRKEKFMSRMAMGLVAADAVCWGALVLLAIHYFTCGA